jgi:hypothetical protein
MDTVLINRTQCLTLIPHTPNFVEEIEYCLLDDKTYAINFKLKFPEDWDFLTNRIFKALPNSIIIEALGQVAMIFFKTTGETGLPATYHISNIKNHSPFLNYEKYVLGSFRISYTREIKVGKIGKIVDCKLCEDGKVFFTSKTSTFVLLKSN